MRDAARGCRAGSGGRRRLRSTVATAPASAVPVLAGGGEHRGQPLEEGARTTGGRSARRAARIERIPRFPMRQGHRGEDPVGLPPDRGARKEASPGDEVRVEPARRIDRIRAEQRMQYRFHRIAERRRPQQPVHRPGFREVPAARVGTCLRRIRVEPERIGEPLAVLPPLPFAGRSKAPRRTRTEVVRAGRRKGRRGRRRRVRLSVLFVGLPCGTSEKPPLP